MSDSLFQVNFLRERSLSFQSAVSDQAYSDLCHWSRGPEDTTGSVITTSFHDSELKYKGFYWCVLRNRAVRTRRTTSY